MYMYFLSNRYMQLRPFKGGHWCFNSSKHNQKQSDIIPNKERKLIIISNWCVSDIVIDCIIACNLWYMFSLKMQLECFTWGKQRLLTCWIIHCFVSPFFLPTRCFYLIIEHVEYQVPYTLKACSWVLLLQRPHVNRLSKTSSYWRILVDWSHIVACP